MVNGVKIRIDESTRDRLKELKNSEGETYTGMLNTLMDFTNERQEP